MSRTMTITRTTMLGLAAVFLVVGALAGVGGAQAIESLLRTRFMNTGLFSVGIGEAVNFHVSLDDRRGGPPARVLLQLLDQNGAAVAREEAILQPGGSKTLSFRQPGLYRAHAQVLESATPLGTRRIAVGTVEIVTIDAASAAAQFLDPLALTIGKPRFVCAIDDSSGGGRIPD